MPPPPSPEAYRRALLAARNVGQSLSEVQVRGFLSLLETYAQELEQRPNFARELANELSTELARMTGNTARLSARRTGELYAAATNTYLEKAGVDDRMTPVGAAATQTLLSRPQLAASFRSIRRDSVEAVDDILKRGVLRGATSGQIARELRLHVLGSEDIPAKLLQDRRRIGRESLIKHLGYTDPSPEDVRRVRHQAGIVARRAALIARTEPMNAEAEAYFRSAHESPIVEALKWHLSSSHGDWDCACEDYAQEDWYGLGSGIFLPAQIPMRPHPRCRCWFEDVLRPLEDWVKPKTLRLRPLVLDPRDVIERRGHTPSMSRVLIRGIALRVLAGGQPFAGIPGGRDRDLPFFGSRKGDVPDRYHVSVPDRRLDLQPPVPIPGRAAGETWNPQAASRSFRTVEAQTEFTRLERELRELDFEQAVVHDVDGNELLVKGGDRNHIIFSLEEADQLRNAVFTHNHPEHGGSFSWDDFQFAVDANLLEMRAVDVENTFSLKRKKKAWPLRVKYEGEPTDVKDVYDAIEDEVADEVEKLLVAGEITLDEANFMLGDLTWERMAEAMPEWLEYRRTPLFTETEIPEPRWPAPKVPWSRQPDRDVLEDLRTMEEQSRGLDHEQLTIVQEGGQMTIVKGNRHSVTLTESQRRSALDAITSHNHPGGDQGFSISDLLSARQVGEVESRVVTKNFVYVIRPPLAGRRLRDEDGNFSGARTNRFPFEQEIEHYWADHYDRIQEEVANAFENGDLPQAEFDLIMKTGGPAVFAHHRFLEEFSRHFDLEYERHRLTDFRVSERDPRITRQRIEFLTGQSKFLYLDEIMPVLEMDDAPVPYFSTTPEFRVERVRLDKVVATQREVLKKRLIEYLDQKAVPEEPEGSDWPGDRPVVYAHPDGSYYVLDGHHRLALAHLEGRADQEVYVIRSAYRASEREPKFRVDLTPGTGSPEMARYDSTRELHEFENQIQNRDHEVLQAWDRGQTVLYTIGGPDYVNLDPKDIPKLRSSVITHNHPGGWGFSLDDLQVMMAARPAELRAISVKTGYLYTLRAQRWPYAHGVPAINIPKLRKVYQHEMAQLGEELQPRIAAGELTQDQALELLNHHGLERIVAALRDEFPDFDIEYKRIPLVDEHKVSERRPRFTEVEIVVSEEREIAEELGLPLTYRGTQARGSKGVDNPLPRTSQLQLEEVQGAPRRVFNAKAVTVELPINTLGTVQDFVRPSAVKRYLDDENFRQILVARVNGEDVVLNGTHHLLAAQLAGKSTVDVLHLGEWEFHNPDIRVSNGDWTLLRSYEHPADVVPTAPRVSERPRRFTRAPLSPRSVVRFEDDGSLGHAGEQAKFDELVAEYGLEETPAEIVRRLANIPDDWQLEVEDFGVTSFGTQRTLSVVAMLRSPEGKLLGTIERLVLFDEKRAVHQTFRLEEEATGKGVGKRVLAGQVEQYQRWGIERITLDAGMDGAARWPKFGLLPTVGAEGWDKVRRRVLQRLESPHFERKDILGRPLSDEAKAAIRALVTDDSPRENIYELAYFRWEGEDLGEALLANLFYEAELDLTNQAQMARFWTYVDPPEPPYQVSAPKVTYFMRESSKIEAQEEFQKLREKHDLGVDSLEDFARRVFDVPDQFELRVNTFGYAEGRFEHVTLNIDLFGPDGLTRAGSLSRRIDFKDKRVIHSSFHLIEGVRGLGLGKRVLKSEMELYHRLKLEKIQLMATNVGSYAWAKFGFLPSQHEWDSLRKGLQHELPDAPWTAEVREILENSDTRAIWILADHPAGKSLLRLEEWSGTLDFSDDEAMARFWSYVNSNRVSERQPRFSRIVERVRRVDTWLQVEFSNGFERVPTPTPYGAAQLGIERFFKMLEEELDTPQHQLLLWQDLENARASYYGGFIRVNRDLSGALSHFLRTGELDGPGVGAIKTLVHELHHALSPGKMDQYTRHLGPVDRWLGSKVEEMLVETRALSQTRELLLGWRGMEDHVDLLDTWLAQVATYKSERQTYAFLVRVLGREAADVWELDRASRNSVLARTLQGRLLEALEELKKPVPDELREKLAGYDGSRALLIWLFKAQSSVGQQLRALEMLLNGEFKTATPVLDLLWNIARTKL